MNVIILSLLCTRKPSAMNSCVWLSFFFSTADSAFWNMQYISWNSTQRCISLHHFWVPWVFLQQSGSLIFWYTLGATQEQVLAFLILHLRQKLKTEQRVSQPCSSGELKVLFKGSTMAVRLLKDLNEEHFSCWHWKHWVSTSEAKSIAVLMSYTPTVIDAVTWTCFLGLRLD